MAFPVIKYTGIIPEKPGNIHSEFLSCIEQLLFFCGDEFKPVKLSVFLNSESEKDFAGEKKLLGEIISKRFSECPAFSVVSQSPAVSFKLSLEAAVIAAGSKLAFRAYNQFPYVVIEADDYKVLWASGLEAANLLSVEEGADVSFGLMQVILMHEGLNFNDIVRQWNYIPQICYVEQRNGALIQHYQSFNEVRHAYYQKYRTKGCFPAATGIGQHFGNFTLDFIAFRCKQSCNDLKVESPLQRNPYQYGQEVLVGTTTQKKHAPEFERARILVFSDEMRILVSGTASIEGEITTDKDSVERQTHSTIRNIESLISKENLFAQYPSLNFSETSFVYLRAYVKYREDISLVEKIVKQKFGEVPVIVVQAEICRCDLLVEIEAELQAF